MTANKILPRLACWREVAWLLEYDEVCAAITQLLADKQAAEDSYHKASAALLHANSIILEEMDRVRNLLEALDYIEHIVGDDFCEELGMGVAQRPQDYTPIVIETEKKLSAIYRAAHSHNEHSCYSSHQDWRDEVARAALAESPALPASENEKLRAFAKAVMESWPEGDVDGGDLQELAEKFGLISPLTVTEPCGEYCRCQEYGDFPQTCYRRTELLMGTALSESPAPAEKA